MFSWGWQIYYFPNDANNVPSKFYEKIFFSKSLTPCLNWFRNYLILIWTFQIWIFFYFDKIICFPDIQAWFPFFYFGEMQP